MWIFLKIKSLLKIRANQSNSPDILFLASLFMSTSQGDMGSPGSYGVPGVQVLRLSYAWWHLIVS